MRAGTKWVGSPITDFSIKRLINIVIFVSMSILTPAGISRYRACGKIIVKDKGSGGREGLIISRFPPKRICLCGGQGLTPLPFTGEHNATLGQILKKRKDIIPTPIEYIR